MSNIKNIKKSWIKYTTKYQDTLQGSIHGHNTSFIFQELNKKHQHFYCHLIVDSYSTLPIFYGMENITTEEVMDKLDIFQDRFGKVDKFSWLCLVKIQTENDTQFTSKKFQ